MSTPMTPQEVEKLEDELYDTSPHLTGSVSVSVARRLLAEVKRLTEALAAQKEADAREIARLKKAATHALGLIVEFANLNGLRNMSDAELGMAVLGVVRELNEVTGGPPWSEARIAEMVRGSQ
jgi:hypothetical protein